MATTLSKKLGFGLVSFAHMHQYGYTKQVMDSALAKVSAVWDDNEKRGREAAKKLNAKYCEDYADFLAKEDVDAVVICTENNMHAWASIEAAKMGKHIICEKPMALTLEDCDRMVREAKKADVKLMVPFPFRLASLCQKIKNSVDSKALGKVFMAKVRNGHDGAFGALLNTWFVDPVKAGGGALLDEGIHCIDALRWLLGEPKEVVAFVDTIVTDLRVDDNGVALLRFENGAIGIVEATWTQRGGVHSLEVYGDNGTALFGGHPPTLKLYIDKEWKTIEEPLRSPNIIDVFAECILKDREPPITGTDGTRAVEIMLACYRSAKTSKKVTFPLK